LELGDSDGFDPTGGRLAVPIQGPTQLELSRWR